FILVSELLYISILPYIPELLRAFQKINICPDGFYHIYCNSETTKSIRIIEVLPLYKKLKNVAAVTTLMMVFVQIGGALVTKTGSADGCGQSCPLCHGKLVPADWPIETIIEIAHIGISVML